MRERKVVEHPEMARIVEQEVSNFKEMYNALVDRLQVVILERDHLIKKFEALELKCQKLNDQISEYQNYILRNGTANLQ